MDFSFSEEQLLLHRSFRDLLQKECPPAAVRAAWENETGLVPRLFEKLGELGFLTAALPESEGGLGLNELDLLLVFEEAGRAALPGPLLEIAAVGVPLLHELAPPALLAEWLPRLAEGTAMLALGLGQSPLVLGARNAQLLLLEHEGALHALLPEQARFDPQRSVDGSRRLDRVAWAPSPQTLLAPAERARPALERAFDRGALAASAELLGLGQHMLDRTVEYVKIRKQFGKPIGSFQAVKHHLTNALLALELCRPVLCRAAWSMAHAHPERSLHVSAAKARASDAATTVGRIALQCHGAIGYSFEHDLHLWMKRAWCLAEAWGSAAFHRARVAETLLSPEGAPEPDRG